MRIVGGRFKGRNLATPKSQDIRPTTDRVRESLFNILAHWPSDIVTDARVLDLFAGTGALGLEALSRGAHSALFVELSSEGRGLIRQNIEKLGLTGCTKISRRDATQPGPAGKSKPYTLIFADPPYGKGMGQKALIAAHQNGWFSDDVTIILEENASANVELPPPFDKVEERKFGDTVIHIFRLADDTR